MLTIGDFILSNMKNGKILITFQDGEGGEFSAEELERVIGEFYKEHF